MHSTNKPRLGRVVTYSCATLLCVAAFTYAPPGCVPEPEPEQQMAPHTPGPSPAGRQKGNVPPKRTKRIREI
jgi:hypothetical protein